MSYLVIQDYKTYIQGNYLSQLVQGDQSKRVIEENSSIAMIAAYLKVRYDLNSEFTETLPYSRTKVYAAGSRVTVDIGANGFLLWITLTNYTVGDLVINNGVGYRCSTANNDAIFTPAKFAVIANQYTIFYAAYPPTCTLQGQPNPSTLMSPYAPVFNYKNMYLKSDIIFWRGYTYVANMGSTNITHTQALQYDTYSNIPYSNIFPDDSVNNVNNAYWKTKTAYAVAADTPLTNVAWVQGDNRNQIIKDAMVAFTVFKLSPLIAPQNSPDVWKKNFIGHRSDLKMYALGEMSLDLPLLQPNAGKHTFYGGNIKKINVI